MTLKATPGSDVIRKVSKATAVLQGFAVVLLLGLVAIFVIIIERYSTLQDGIRENALWSLYQLDRETRKLHEGVHVAIVEGDETNETWQLTSQHYDILYSRMNIVQQGNFDRKLGGQQDTGPMLNEIEATILKLEPVFDEVNRNGSVNIAALRQVDAELDILIGKTEGVLVYANTAVSADRAEARADLLSLQLKSAGLVGLLVASVGCLIFLLMRQLRSVRAAGLSFERMARDLRRSYLAAEAGNRAKSQFMATMGHEIRTPLNAILGTAELMQLQPLPEKVNAGIGTIRRSGEALLAILNQVLDFARSEDGRLTVEIQPASIAEVVAGAVDMLRDRAIENGNRIELEMPSSLRFPVVETDPTRLKQVLLNLVSNAIKFTEGGTVTVRLEERLNLGGARLRFEVADTGIGIDEEGIRKLFQPFSQVDASINRRFGGTGLGLAISKEIVERLGGTVGVSSKKGAGSRFWFELPAIEATSQPAPALVPPRGPLPALRVLLVEDNSVNQQVAAGFLKHLGQEVDLANDGFEAVEMAAKNDYDVILMDMQMPNMDGVEASTRIRAMGGPRSQTPIIAITANASEDDRSRCITAGMNGFQSKPISVEKLRGVIQSIAPSGAPAQIESRLPAVNEPSFEARRQEIAEVLGEDGFAELLAHFFDDATMLVGALQKAAESGDAATRDRLLHTLKGAASNVGFQMLADECQDLRQRPLTDEVVTEIQSMIDDCRRRLAA